MDYLPYLLLLLALFLVAMQLYLYFSMKSMQGKPAPPCDDLLNEAQRTMPVLLFYFHSEYCAPCRRLTPLIETLAQSGAVITIDVSVHPEPARRFGVRATPTMMRVSHGVIEKVVVGEVGEAKLRQLLQ